MKLKELAMLLSVPKEQRDELKEVLDILIAEGKIGISKKGKYGKAEEFALAGTFSGHAKGFGFVTIEGREQDVFIPADKKKAPWTGIRSRSSLKAKPEENVPKEQSYGYLSMPTGQ